MSVTADAEREPLVRWRKPKLSVSFGRRQHRHRRIDAAVPGRHAGELQSHLHSGYGADQREVVDVAERFNATPFDIENVFWSHRGEFCTFDVMVKEFGLTTPPLQRLATIVRAADTARLDLSPEAPGLLAASLGLSRMFNDDLEQLSAGLLLYDAFYRWCRDATRETHNWPTSKVKP